MHGAIGYTAELDLSLWLTKVRALRERLGLAGVPPRRRPPGTGCGLMDFAFSEEQQELAATVRSLLAKRADSAAVRSAMASEAGYDEALWQTMCEQIGVAALAVPEEYGGAGFSLLESMIVLEEVGRSLAPSPLLSSVVTAEALLAGGTDVAKEQLLPRIAAGEVAAFAVPGEPSLFADCAAVLLLAGDELTRCPRDPLSGCRRWTRRAGWGRSRPPRAPRRVTPPRRAREPGWSERSAWPRCRRAWRPAPWR